MRPTNSNSLSQNGYTYGDNNPSVKIDHDGNDAMWLTAKHRTNGARHTTLLIQYKKQWYYFWNGPKNNGLFNAVSKLVLKNLNYLKILGRLII